MSWILFAVLAMVLTTAAALTQKKTLKSEHAMEYSAVLAMFNAMLMLPFIPRIEWSAVTPVSLGLMFTVSLLASVAFLLVAKAIRHSPISTISPLLILSPAITAVLAFLLLGESLSLLQIGGLALLVIGTYILEARKSRGLLTPFKHLFTEKYHRLVLLALLLYGFTSTVDKKILGAVADNGLAIPLTTYMPIVHIMISINFLLMLSFFHEGLDDVKHGIMNVGPWILLMSLLTLGYRFSQGHALTFEGSKVALVLGIKKTSALASTLLGGELFHESNLLQKSLACVIMMIGAMLIIS